MTQNPFPIGIPVTGADFAGRQTELDTLLSEAQSQGRLFVISPRRYGKTSLLLEARNRFQVLEIPVAYVDIFRATSLAHFLDLFARAVLEATEGTVERTARLADELLPKTRQVTTANAQGKLEWTLGFSQHQPDLLTLRD